VAATLVSFQSDPAGSSSTPRRLRASRISSLCLLVGNLFFVQICSSSASRWTVEGGAQVGFTAEEVNAGVCLNSINEIVGCIVADYAQLFAPRGITRLAKGAIADKRFCWNEWGWAVMHGGSQTFRIAPCLDFEISRTIYGGDICIGGNAEC
jgi:hypothetical protein